VNRTDQARAAVRVGTSKVEAAPSSVTGVRAPGKHGLTSPFSFARFASTGNSDIQGDPSRHTRE
jgi:hypothetical protein